MTFAIYVLPKNFKKIIKNPKPSSSEISSQVWPKTIFIWVENKTTMINEIIFVFFFCWKGCYKKSLNNNVFRFIDFVAKIVVAIALQTRRCPTLCLFQCEKQCIVRSNYLDCPANEFNHNTKKTPPYLNKRYGAFVQLLIDKQSTVGIGFSNTPNAQQNRRIVVQRALRMEHNGSNWTTKQKMSKQNSRKAIHIGSEAPVITPRNAI